MEKTQLRNITTLSRADEAFTRLSRVIITKLRKELRFPPARVDSGVDEEVGELEIILESFRSEFYELHGKVLLDHLGPGCLNSVAKALSHPEVQRFFEARTAMAGELDRMMQALARRMGSAHLRPRS